MTRPTALIPFVVAMALIVVASNVLVQFPMQGTLGGVALADVLTWGAFTYPFSFLVTDLANRRYGPQLARRVVFVGFMTAVVCSIALPPLLFKLGLIAFSTDADRLARIEADPSRLDQVEERLAQVERLCRRYGGSTEEVLALRKRIEEELAELSGEGASHEELAAALRDALADYGERARELSRRRREWGERLARKIETELAELGLAKARLAIELERRSRPGSGLEVEGQEVEPGPEGYDQVVFLLAPNPGEPLAPLARIASGGELSRLYLALQLAVGAERQGLVPTLIFDEVDTGVGGAQAAALGEKLQRLAGRNQIVVVTHLPQVASFGDHHLRIQKVEKGGRTFTSVAVLDAGARVEELARMLAGSQITELSRSHAREMLEGAARRP